MRVMFFGNGQDYSLAFLEAVAATDGCELVAIVSPVAAPGAPRAPTAPRLSERLAARLPDSLHQTLPRNVRQKFAVAVARTAHRTGAEVFWPDTVNDPCLIDQLELLCPEIVVMAGFTEILKPFVVDAVSPVINAHPSLLPDFRGPHPEFWTIAEGATEGGVTLHVVDEGIDTGSIVAQERFDIEPWLTSGALHKRCTRVGARMIQKLLADYDAAHTPTWPQQGEGSYYGKVGADDVVVPFDDTVERVFARSRAATPWLSLILWVPREFWDRGPRPSRTAAASRGAAPGLVRLAVGDAVPFPGVTDGSPGTVRLTEDRGLVVTCTDGTVVFRSVASLK